jgi:hypothetical protein
MKEFKQEAVIRLPLLICSFCFCCAHGAFRYFELCSTCLKEGLARSKPEPTLRTRTLTHCMDFYYIQALLNHLL